jgi:threonine dehydratase
MSSKPYPPDGLPPAYVSGPWAPLKSSGSESSPSSNPAYSDLAPHLRLPDGNPDYLRLILSADIYSLVKQTPLTVATNLSTKLGCEVLMKREDLQPVFSFKLRGAFNMMRQLTEEQKWKGVIACSAGNHAQGVALSGSHLSIPCTIVMPMGTPSIKTENVKRLGAKVVLHGLNFDEAKAECSRLAEIHDLKIIPPFDEPRIIAGQGTVAVEVCKQTDMSKVDAIFCCVGGGGLISGVAAYIKRIAPPGVKVIAVETFDADALARSLEHGDRVTLDEVGLFADGTAVRIVGEECFRLCHDLVDGIVRVDTDEICAAIQDVFEGKLSLTWEGAARLLADTDQGSLCFADTRSIPEPSGALAVAGMKRYIIENNLQDSGKRFVATVSGANMNFSRLRFVSERSELGQRKEVLLMVEIPEQPGSFLTLIKKIFPRGISEFSYRYSDKSKAQIFLSFLLDGNPKGAVEAAGALPIPPPAAAAAAAAATASVLSHHATAATIHTSSTSTSSSSTPGRVPSPVGLANHRQGNGVMDAASVGRRAELDQLLESISRDGMKAIDISNNEMAKSHARYMVGGKGGVEHERLFSFTFPERPGALLRFLQGLNQGWNISLFNYRNNGGDTANVLVGIQVDPKDYDEFQRYLDALQYLHIEETNNEAYLRFMR